MSLPIRIPAAVFRRLACGVALPWTAALLACAPAGQEAEGPAATAAGVEAAFRSFVEAWESQDVDGVVGSFTADAVALDPVPPVKFAGSEAIRTLASGAFETADRISIPISELEVRTRGPVAWLTARYTYEAEAGGDTAAEEGYVSMVWVTQDDGSYRATLFHASNLPEEEPPGGA